MEREKHRLKHVAHRDEGVEEVVHVVRQDFRVVVVQQRVVGEGPVRDVAEGTTEQPAAGEHSLAPRVPPLAEGGAFALVPAHLHAAVVAPSA